MSAPSLAPSLEEALLARRETGRKLLAPYVTGGLGPGWLDLLDAVVAAGADAVEVGIPFSDPSIDGPTINLASAAALRAGATPLSILDDLATHEVGVPVVVMTYYNLVFRAGHQRLASLLADAGVSGAIVPDLPLELADDWIARTDDAGVANVLMVAPVSSDDRIRNLAARTRGFLYCVSVMGTTGERATTAPTATVIARRTKALTDRPVLVGFGVSRPDQAVEIAADADGVIVASALMRRVLDGAAPEEAASLIADMRVALDGAYPPAVGG